MIENMQTTSSGSRRLGRAILTGLAASLMALLLLAVFKPTDRQLLGKVVQVRRGVGWLVGRLPLHAGPALSERWLVAVVLVCAAPMLYVLVSGLAPQRAQAPGHEAQRQSLRRLHRRRSR